MRNSTKSCPTTTARMRSGKRQKTPPFNPETRQTMKNITASPPAPAQSVATSQGTHTPGPWQANPIGDTGRCSISAPHPSGGGQNVIDECLKENARLIAAAPDLLAALDKLAPYALQRAETEPPFTAKYARADYEIARAAIAKATGGAK